MLVIPPFFLAKESPQKPRQGGGKLTLHGHTKRQGHGYKAYYTSLEFYVHMVAALLVIECPFAVAFLF